MTNKTVLITGGAGYIGTVLAKKLIEKNYKVRILDCLFFGDNHLKNIVKEDNEILKIDLRNIENHSAVLDDIYAVIHLAALSNDPSCELNPQYTLENNINAGKKLIELCRQKEIQRFIFSSSCSVYGAAGDNELNEESARNPVSLYAKSKVEIENTLLHLADEKFSPTILRHGTIFGYSPRMRFDLIVNTMTKSALSKGLVKIFGGGKNWRPNVHVDDVAEAFIKVLEAPIEKVSGETFNVGSNELNHTVEEVAKIVSNTIPNTKIEYIPSNDDARSYKVNFNKIEKTLGFKAKKSIEDGIKEIIERVNNKEINLDEKNHVNMEIMKELDMLPAKEGGLTTRYNFLPLATPSIGNEEIKEITEAIISGWVTRGPKTALFEEKIKEYCKAKYVHGLNSCTAALHLALIALGINNNDEVIMSPVTFSSAANVIIHQNAKPVFVDVEKETLNIDPKKIEEKITPRTKAIMTTDIAGQPCNYKEIKKIAKKYNLKIIQDAAHSIGAEYEEHKIGNISDITCFSFYATKNLTTGEGGMILTNNKDIYETAKLYSLHGMSRDAWKRYTAEGSPHWETLVPGYKYNMTDIQSAIGLHQIKKLDKFIEKRQEYAKIYNEAFKNTEGIILPKHINNIKHAYHLYIIILDLDKLKINRDEFVNYLKSENIGTGIHFISLHRHKYYKEKFNLKDEDYPNASYISDRIISLPLCPSMTHGDVNDVIKAVKKTINFSLKK